MEGYVTDLVNSLGKTLSTAVGGLIAVAIGALGYWLKKELVKRQSMRLSVVEAETQLEIKRLEAEKKRLAAVFKSKGNVDRVINVLKQLEQIYNKTQCSIAFIIAYHNSIAENFRNFSIRYCYTRLDKDYDYEEVFYKAHQHRGLSTYFKIIKKYEENDVMVYMHDDDKSPENRDIINLMRRTGNKKCMMIPLLVETTYAIPKDGKLIAINKDGIDYYVVGSMAIFMDSESTVLTEEQLEYSKDRVEDIVKIYKENPTVMGIIMSINNPYWASVPTLKKGGSLKKKNKAAVYEGVLYPTGLSYSHRADSFFKALVQEYKHKDNEVQKSKSINSKGRKGRKELGFESS